MSCVCPTYHTRAMRSGLCYHKLVHTLVVSFLSDIEDGQQCAEFYPEFVSSPTEVGFRM